MFLFFFFFKQKTAYEMRISDWISDVCSSDLPALLTSFAPDRKSDGLLQFSGIFDLRLNADLVVLSACDTAGAAGAETTLAAGLSGGGGALDGLVRAFIGA